MGYITTPLQVASNMFVHLFYLFSKPYRRMRLFPIDQIRVLKQNASYMQKLWLFAVPYRRSRFL